MRWMRRQKSISSRAEHGNSNSRNSITTRFAAGSRFIQTLWLFICFPTSMRERKTEAANKSQSHDFDMTTRRANHNQMCFRCGPTSFLHRNSRGHYLQLIFRWSSPHSSHACKLSKLKSFEWKIYENFHPRSPNFRQRNSKRPNRHIICD